MNAVTLFVPRAHCHAHLHQRPGEHGEAVCTHPLPGCLLLQRDGRADVIYAATIHIRTFALTKAVTCPRLKLEMTSTDYNARSINF